MSSEHIPIRAFLGQLSKWLEAIQNHQTDDAGYFVDELHAVGQMLALDPEFGRIYAAARRRSETNPQEALDCVHDFLWAVTDSSRAGRFRNHRSQRPKE